MSDFASAPFAVEIAVDDCWNRIGVRGDNSCVKLKEYFRCLNCPTFASAASALLDRPVFGDDAGASVFSPASEGEDAVQAEGKIQARGRGNATASMLAFRVGAEWLAFPTAAVVEVIEARAVHSLPGQANPAVLGLTNIRGALKICVSLGRMLGMAAADTASTKTAQRLLVVEHEQQVLVFPVDEVAGVYGYAADAVQAPPSTMAQAGMTYTQSLIAWRDRQLGLLDCGLLFYALNRSLT
jgi:chemotaxis-related protein WspD